MGKAQRILQKRKRARETLARLMSDPEHVVVIHYSCESFYDRPNGTSPRITSIAVRNLGTAQTVSFSIHQVAERQSYSIAEIDERYDDLERQMLDEFYDYVRTHQGFIWLHWNMRDINYGFQAIAHRYRVLGGTPIIIEESRLVDLSRLLVAIYGIGYIGHPRLVKLVEKNKISKRDFLTGAEEAEAFERREYVRLHLSTLRKVDILANIAERSDSGILKTNATWREIYGLYPEAIAEWLKEHWIPTLIGALLTIAGFIWSIIH